MKLESMTLWDLKNLMTILRIKYDLLKSHRIYNLCKYDLVCILRNSGYIYEEDGNYINVRILKIDEDKNNIEFTYHPIKPFKRRRRKVKGSNGWTTDIEEPEFKIKRGNFIVKFE